MHIPIQKVTIMGLGRLGGSLAAISYFLKRGIAVHVTDQKSKEELKDSLDQFLGKEGITFHCGGHEKEDFIGSDAVICSPAVPQDSQWVKCAQQYAPVYNDLSFFLKEYGDRITPYIAVTGTRGKTTTTQWIAHILGSSLYGGNMPQRGFFWLAERVEEGEGDPLVVETSSFQLEYMDETLPAPHVAVLTNLFVDHINRHKTMEVYGSIKARIALYQGKDDHVIFNADDPGYSFFKTLSYQSQQWCISLSLLPQEKKGLYLEDETIRFRDEKGEYRVGIVPSDMGRHMKYNLLASLLASYLFKGSWEGLFERIATLPSIPLRQEKIVENEKYLVVNDGAATSPDAVIAALERFYVPGTAFVIGGTDKGLDMSGLASVLGERVSPDDVFFLEGSGTEKLLGELSSYEAYKGKSTYESLEAIVIAIVQKGYTRIVFSPGGSSFEKFQNEFHRGDVFSDLIRKHIDV